MIDLRFLTVLVGFGALCYAQDAPTVQIKVVKDAPFSAQATTEVTQVLGDGNHITHKKTGTVTRDSQGRTRREQILANGASMVFIHDPVAGVAYVVDPIKKSARRISISNSDSKSVDSALNNGESLGSQVIEGLQVAGTRVTHTLAAGEAGNESPIEVSIEVWYSSDLQTVLMRKTSDPRAGETVYKLSGIQRGEPDHSLFEIPADYSVRDKP